MVEDPWIGKSVSIVRANSLSTSDRLLLAGHGFRHPLGAAASECDAAGGKVPLVDPPRRG